MNKPTTTQMQSALAVLRQLVADGMEYPDAHIKVCAMYGLGHGYYAERLQELYDQEGN